MPDLTPETLAAAMTEARDALKAELSNWVNAEIESGIVKPLAQLQAENKRLRAELASREAALRGESDPEAEPFVFLYTNWRGVMALRRVMPLSIRFGSTEWHQDKGWLLRALDLDKNEEREFAVAGIAPVEHGDSGWMVGDRVEKFTGDARWVGTIRSRYLTGKGKVRVVVEVEPQGFQMIAAPDQLCEASSREGRS